MVQAGVRGEARAGEVGKENNNEVFDQYQKKEAGVGHEALLLYLVPGAVQVDHNDAG